MSERRASFEVLHQGEGQSKTLSLLEGVTDAHLRFVEDEWKPLLAGGRDRAVLGLRALPPAEQTEEAWQAKQRLYGAPDSHWDWTEKNRTLAGASQRLYAITDGDSVEALMQVDLSKASRLETGAYAPIVYVEYVAVAPWNRAPIQTPVRYKGLGRLMVGVAVAVSQAEGMAGRCGLHSLKQSEGFYLKLGITDLGIDQAADGLRYFEFSVAAAEALMEEV